MRALLRLRLLAVPLLVVGASLSAAACSDAPSKDQCARLLEHLIDIEIAAGGGGGTEMTPEMKADLDKQKKAIADFAQGEGKNFMQTCTSKTPKAVVECGLAAKTKDDVAKCDEGK
jgi:hypothetical protein